MSLLTFVLSVIYEHCGMVGSFWAYGLLQTPDFFFGFVVRQLHESKRDALFWQRKQFVICYHVMMSYLILVNILEQANKFLSLYTTVNSRLFVYFSDWIYNIESFVCLFLFYTIY